jgi:hypothetical protein
MSARPTSQWPLPIRQRRNGQALLEYSLIVYVLALSGGVAIITVLPMLMRALNGYLNGYYYLLNLAVP